MGNDASDLASGFRTPEPKATGSTPVSRANAGGTPLFDWVPPAPGRMRFDGPEYAPELDRPRLSDQHVRIRELMLDGQWRTIQEIAQRTGDPQASVSAQLRHLRKERFGAFVVDRRKRGDRKRGLFEYCVRPPDPSAPRAEHGAESKAVIQHLRDELRLLRAVALEAADILDGIDMGEDGGHVEQVAHVLRLRALGTKRAP